MCYKHGVFVLDVGDVDIVAAKLTRSSAMSNWQFNDTRNVLGIPFCFSHSDATLAEAMSQTLHTWRFTAITRGAGPPAKCPVSKPALPFERWLSSLLRETSSESHGTLDCFVVFDWREEVELAGRITGALTRLENSFFNSHSLSSAIVDLLQVNVKVLGVGVDLGLSLQRVDEQLLCVEGRSARRLLLRNRMWMNLHFTQ